MKIILITKNISKGGSASGARNLAAALEAAGSQVVVVDSAHKFRSKFSFLYRFFERIIERITCNAETHFVRLGPATHDIRALVNFYNPDIVQLCDVSGNIINLNDLKEIDCPVVHRMSDFWPYHGPRHYSLISADHSSLSGRCMKTLIYSGSSFADARVAPSHWLKEILVEESGIEDIKVILNAVAFRTNKSRTLINHKSLRFGFIASSILDPRKGFNGLARFLSALSFSGFEVSLHLYGRIPRSRVPDVPGVLVMARGSFNQESICGVFDDFDILLCPSLLDNSPNVVSESLAFGRPVIAQAGTGMDSYISMHAGFLFDFVTGEEDDFVAACKALAENYANFSACALKYVSEFLAPTEIGNEYMSLYSELLRSKSCGVR